MLNQGECIIAAIIIALITLDLITGTIQSIYNKTFMSSKMRQGLWHKTSIIFVLVLGWLLKEYASVVGLPEDITAILPVIQTAIVVMESASILENIAQINPEIRKLVIFRVLKEESDKKKEEE